MSEPTRDIRLSLDPSLPVLRANAADDSTYSASCSNISLRSSRAASVRISWGIRTSGYRSWASDGGTSRGTS
ncbi:hypothetical protein FSP39_019432 [Pinctada imbricata]|uniref:Uncharacterized protein n=1 Tax=Pinctada imbricata TaxID=66713 RepID=A0AA88YNY7_PINIB|nr:hypothetical protein FSP39_019432 [Pinctada imbricata]